MKAYTFLMEVPKFREEFLKAMNEAVEEHSQNIDRQVGIPCLLMNQGMSSFLMSLTIAGFPFSFPLRQFAYFWFCHSYAILRANIPSSLIKT